MLMLDSSELAETLKVRLGSQSSWFVDLQFSRNYPSYYKTGQSFEDEVRLVTIERMASF